MASHLDSIMLAFLVFSCLVFVLHLINVYRSDSDRSDRHGRNRRRWVGVGASGAVALASVFLYLRVVAPWPSPFSIRLDAIRSTSEDHEPIDLSLRCYDSRERLIKRVYTKGKLDPEAYGTSWRTLEDREYKALSTRSISDENVLYLRIVLNPGRLLTPPDAVFASALNLPRSRSDPSNPTEYTLLSQGKGEFEIRLFVIRR